MAETRHSTVVDIKVDDREIVQLGQALERTFTTQVIETFTKAIERQTKVFDQLLKQQEKLKQTLEQTFRLKKQDRDEEERKPLSFMQTVGATGIGSFLGNSAYGLGQRIMGIGGAAVRGGMSEAVMRSVPGGGVLADTAAGAQQYYQQGVAAAEARMGGYGKAGMGTGGMNAAMGGWGVRMGLDPTQIPAMLAQIATQTGMSGNQLARVAPSMAGASRFAGIESAGAVVGAAGEAGGAVTPARAIALLKDTVGTALQDGIRESRLDQYFQGLSSWVEQMRSRGILIEPESVNAMVRGLAQTNAEVFRGMAGLNAVKGLSEGMSGAMKGRGLATAIMLDVTGVTKGKNYFEALEEVQNDPMKFSSQVLQRMQQMGKGMPAATVGGLINMIFPNASLSQGEAREFGQLDPSVLAAQFGQNAAQASVDKGYDFLGRRLAGAPLGMLPTEKGRRMQEIGLGENPAVSGLSQHLLQLDLSVTKSLLPAMSKLTDTLFKLGEAAFHATGLDKVGSAKPKYGAEYKPGEDVVVPDEDREAYDQNVKFFGKEDADRIQSVRNREYAAYSEPGLERFKNQKFAYSDEVQNQLPQAAAPASTGGAVGGPKRSMEAAALHLRAAADILGAAGDAVDMSFTLSETEASGGH